MCALGDITRQDQANKIIRKGKIADIAFLDAVYLLFFCKNLKVFENIVHKISQKVEGTK